MKMLFTEGSLSAVNNKSEFLVESFSASAPSLRIAIVTETFPPEVNGVAMTLGRIVDGLLKRGHVVQLIRPRQAIETPSAAFVGLDEVLSVGLPVPAYGELRFGLPAKRRLTNLWKEKRPDVVHVVTEGPLGWSAVAAARALQLPITSSFHTNFQSYSQHYGVGLLKKPIDSYLRKLHNRTQATMVPTRAMAVELQSRGYKSVMLMSRGVATELFRPERRSPELRASWGAEPGTLVVVHVGRMAKEKNLPLVISAFRAIQSKVPKAKMVFVGDGPMRKQVELSFPEAIFSGMRIGEELAAHYASGDLFLFPSLTETFGNVVPEALASGLAVLSYDRAAANELIVDGHNGVLVSDTDELSFVTAAVALASDPAKIEKIRQVAPASVAHVGWDAVHDTFVKTISDVIEQHGSHFGASFYSQNTTPLSHSSA
jgi:glycosyltransferase involved in cell wall biosynthesis